MADDIVTRLRNGDGFCAGDHEEQCPVPDCEKCGLVYAAADEIERLRQALWDCAIIAGEDPDGNSTPRSLTHPDIDVFAYRAVRQLREDYDMLLVESEAMKVEALAKENLRLYALVEEIVPFVLRDVECALRMGPEPAGHEDDDCEDCRWYKDAIVWKQRIDNGELGDVVIGD
jgi:hypothetical protein